MTEEQKPRNFNVPFADKCYPVLHAMMGDITPSKWNRECKESGTRLRVFVLGFDRKQFNIMLNFHVAAYENIDWGIPLLPPYAPAEEEVDGELDDNLFGVAIARNQGEAASVIPELLRLPGKQVLWLCGDPEDFNLTQWNLINVEVHYHDDSDLADWILEAGKTPNADSA